MPLLHIGGYEWLNWQLHPDVVILCFGLLGAYLFTVRYLRRRLSDAGRVNRSQVVAFLLGVATIYAASGSPIHDLADQYLMSFHMLQHVLLTMVAAPLLLVGTPGWVWQAVLRNRRLLPIARLVTKPIVAFALFNAALLMFHLPVTIDIQVRLWGFHLFAHIALVTTGVIMWWPVFSNVPELPRLSYPMQMAYLFVQSLLPAVLAAFLTFSSGTIYTFYDTTPRIWGLTPLDDQQFAGLIMKLLGSFILWLFIGIAFFRWFVREEREAKGSPSWQEVEHELDQMGMGGRREAG